MSQPCSMYDDMWSAGNKHYTNKNIIYQHVCIYIYPTDGVICYFLDTRILDLEKMKPFK